MNGKNRCRILKDIRKKIADENGIEYITTECKYKGDCLGTCPKCESEVRYLERELERKRTLGKRVAVAGIAVGITATATGCTPDIASLFNGGTLQGEPMPELDGDLVAEYSQNKNNIDNESGVSEVVTDGELVEIDGNMPEYSSDFMGEESETSYDFEISDPYELVGDIEVFPYKLEEVFDVEYNELIKQLSAWSRDFIDYEWREYIIDRTENKTVLMSKDGREVTVIYDDNGCFSNINFIVEPLMGDISV